MNDMLADILHLTRRFDHECARADYWHEHGNRELCERNQRRAIATCCELRKLEREYYPTEM